jgi:preprotein translocase subunit SecE
MEQTQVVARGGGRPMQWLRGGRDFLVAVRAELGKVSWPTQEELVKATKMVVILSAIIGVALGLLDLLLTTILLNGVAALAR